jgi:hypothetical protein
MSHIFFGCVIRVACISTLLTVEDKLRGSNE